MNEEEKAKTKAAELSVAACYSSFIPHPSSFIL
jgi:hypothetical protein